MRSFNVVIPAKARIQSPGTCGQVWMPALGDREAGATEFRLGMLRGEAWGTTRRENCSRRVRHSLDRMVFFPSLRDPTAISSIQPLTSGDLGPFPSPTATREPRAEQIYSGGSQ